eukprot:CAMPEP_0119479594 /NCGR_PEP_ID=MMETSP1344-20130328/8788_1 /TAXON_ID=236787 /ORGANISM="Florenciella parvula, Strain CCMP2471" /LENGTH=1700 /DNA_ID=CAMNT_0007513837 /DNA_START=186 /DNA_END=5285 /DNA_ORIENTATION=+
MSLKARAEMGLLATLDQPRVSAATQGPKAKISVPPAETLLAWRNSHEKMVAFRAAEEDRDAVAALNHQPIDPNVRHKELPKLAERAKQKRVDHDSFLKQFELKLTEISDDLEIRVMHASRGVQKATASNDQRIGETFGELNQDLLLVTKDHQYVLDSWDEIHAVCEKRFADIRGFAAELEGIERDRARVVATELRQLVERLMGVAYMPGTEIERLVEEQAFELNTVIVLNRKSHAELLALMEKQHVLVCMDARVSWEARQKAWRKLRHDHAIDMFQEELGSKAYTNPPARIELFRKAEEAQQARQAERTAHMAKLGDMTLPESAVVSELLAEFEKLNGREGTAIDELLAGIEDIRTTQVANAEQRRESLRAELHEYGALEPEPDLGSVATQIDAVLTDSSLDAFFRGAGGLKHALKEISTELRHPDLIYARLLSPTIKGLQNLLCGLGLPEVLEVQGKATMRESLCNTLERLRLASKSDVIPIIPILLAQVNELLTVKELDPLLQHYLGEAKEDLESLVRDLDIMTGGGGGGGSESRSGSDSRSHGGRTGTSRTGTGAGSRKGSASTVGRKSIARSNSRSSRGGGAAHSGGGWEQPEVNMLEVRSVQKRLMMLMQVSELDKIFQETLSELLVMLRQKEVCNSIVDQVVADECTAPLDARKAEQVEVADNVIRFLERNTSHVHEVSVRLGTFYLCVAKILEMHSKHDIELDEKTEEELDDSVDRFKTADDQRTADIGHWENALRLAAGDEDLEIAYNQVIKLLAEVQESYYAYHKDATECAEAHPQRVFAEAASFMEKLCESLGMVPQPAEEAAEAVAAAEEAARLAASLGSNKPQVGADGRLPVGAEVEMLLDLNQDGPIRDGPDVGVVDTDKALAFADREAHPWASIVGVFKLSDSALSYGMTKSCELIVENMLEPPDGLEEEGDEEDEGEGAQEDEEEETPAEGEADEAGEADENEEEEEPEPEDWEVPWWQPDESGEPFVSLAEEDMAALAGPALADYVERKMACFKKLTAEEVEELPTKARRAEYKTIKSEVRDIRRAKRASQMEAIRMSYFSEPPVDGDGNSCCSRVMLPSDGMVTMLEMLRFTLVSDSETKHAARTKEVTELCGERKDVLTEELETRLRLHWPKKGRVETRIRQVREGQLIAHRQRAERHVRAVNQKNSAHQREFDSLVAQYGERCEFYKRSLEDLEATLPAQESLAALQGVEGKCRKMVAGFKDECEEALDDLTRFTETEPHKLHALSMHLIDATYTFESGEGDYSQQEEADLRAHLEVLDKSIDAAVATRVAAIDALAERQVTAIGVEAEFVKAFKSSLQELSLREAIGMKYGAPRRNAQERLRTEQTCDQNSKLFLDGLLDQLEDLCVSTRTAIQAGEGSKALEALMAATPPRAALLRELLLAVRSLVMRRAEYLEFMPAPERIDSAAPVSKAGYFLNASKSEIAAGNSALKAAVPAYTVTLAPTMAAAIDQLEERCRSETRKLYEDEGRPELLGPEGVPDALKEWLAKSRDDVLAPLGVRDTSRAALREQVTRLERIIAKTPVPVDPNWTGAPAACLEDCTAHAHHAAMRSIELIESRFQAQRAVWDAARAKHEAALRPQMGRPDAAAEREALMAAEKARCDEVKAAVKAVRSTLIDGQLNHAASFVSTLRDQTSAVLLIVDTLVLSDDLGYLPGDEMIEKKRKSLKRLKKAQRRASAEA